MDLHEFFKKFLLMEERFNLYSIRVRDIYVWERVRNAIRKRIRDVRISDSSAQVNNEESQHSFRKKANLIKYGGDLSVNILKNLVNKNPYLAGESEYLFFGFSRRKLESDDLWWDVYVDPFVSEYSNRSVVIENPREGTHKSPPKTDPLRYTDLIENVADIHNGYRKFIREKRVFASDEEKKLRQLERQINDYFDIEINVREIIEERLHARKVRLNMYEKLLKKIQPEVAIVVVSHWKADFIEACKRLDIPVVGLQQGLLSEYDISHSHPDIDRQLATYPDYFFTWSDFWTQHCRDDMEMPIPEENIRPVGYPYAELKYKKCPPDNGGDIIFISQNMERLSNKISDMAIKLDKKLNDRNIIYKLHPSEKNNSGKKLSLLKDSGVEIKSGIESDLYELFSQCSIQVGISSTALYEGLAWGLDTYLLEAPVTKLLDPIATKWNIPTVNSPDELIYNIRNSDSQRPTEFKDIFETESISNISNELDNIKKTT